MKDENGQGLFHSGYVTIAGKPNVGKSTFLNSILGEKVSIVTSKPQTTRNRIIGIKTLKDSQIIFIDTPGIHKPRHALGALMVKRAKEALRDVDVILFMVEPSAPSYDDIGIVKLLKGFPLTPVFLLINKTDTVKKPMILPVIEEYKEIYPFKEIIPVSALKGDGIDIVLERILEHLPLGPKYYPDDLVTDQLERFMVSEIIREKVMEETEEEVPHACAVEVIDWSEEKDIISISANIYVEKNSQKGIIIGKAGLRLKAVGTSARADIERMLNTKVYLRLWVKVKPHWRKNETALAELGLK
ncbi:MAG: GTPase Era [Nitrospirae bacterium]|nr:GTPase Era [Nitrospirota bacterium]